MPMKNMTLREAKAAFSALVAAAERGEATTITKHGRPAAVVVPIETARDLLTAPSRKSFASHLMSFPSGMEFERVSGATRDVDL
jgi:prevent-host-death family protein